MNRTIKLVLFCVGGIVLGLLSSPVFSKQVQPIEPSHYYLADSAYPSPGGGVPIYMPLVYNKYPPYPNTPSLDAINNPENSTYSLSWSETPDHFASSYIVQEATDSNFTQNLREACNTPQLYCTVSDKLAGTYYYQVQGVNSWGSSDWSNVQPSVVLLPEIPALQPVDNSDGNNLYTLNWSVTARTVTYVLQESTDPAFTNPVIKYSASATTWSTPAPGKTPASYYYRIKSSGPSGESSWSNTQSVTIYPMFVGLNLRYDGKGYIRGSAIYDIGTHWENNFDLLTAPDIVRSNNRSWYDPNPLGWGTETWYSYYTISTGQWVSSSVPPDPSWKWGFPLMTGYTSQFVDGQTVTIDGQPFSVKGPISGYTAFGKPVQYWEFVNNDKFLYWDGGGDWTQYCNPGDVILRYEAGNTKLLLYDNVTRRYYYKGSLVSDTVQYIDNLTSSNLFSAGPAVLGESQTLSTLPPFTNSSKNDAWADKQKPGIR